MKACRMHPQQPDASALSHTVKTLTTKQSVAWPPLNLLPSNPSTHFVECSEGVEPQLLQLFNHLESFPLWLQEGLAPLLLQGLERINDDINTQQGVKEAGPDRLKVYLSMQLFWPGIPRQGLLAKVLKATLLMNEQAQTVFCFRFAELIALVAVYMQVCAERNKQPQPRHITVIFATAVELGITEAQRKLTQELLN
jgi:hypothetical protein